MSVVKNSREVNAYTVFDFFLFSSRLYPVMPPIASVHLPLSDKALWGCVHDQFQGFVS